MRYVPTALFVLLVVLSQAVGCKKTEDEATPTPGPGPIIGDTLSAIITYTGIPIPGFPISFTTNSTQKKLTWNFGDGSGPDKVGDTCSHTYKSDSSYTVRLYADKKLIGRTTIKIDRTAFRFGFEDKVRNWKVSHHMWGSRGFPMGGYDTTWTEPDITGAILRDVDTLFFSGSDEFRFTIAPGSFQSRDTSITFTRGMNYLYYELHYSIPDDKVYLSRGQSGSGGYFASWTYYTSY